MPVRLPPPSSRRASVETEWDPEIPESRKRYLAALHRARRRSAGALYRRTWLCDRIDCDGQPHHGFDRDHARGPAHRSPQVIDKAIWRDHQVANLEGGRGSGKTWAGSHNFAQMILDAGGYDEKGKRREWGVIVRTFAQGRSVAIEGESGLIVALGGMVKHGGLVKSWNRTDGELVLDNGGIVFLDSANDGAIRVQGKNLSGAWCEEPGLWQRWEKAWNESLGFAVRKGDARIICTGTPKRIGLSKFLHSEEGVWTRRLLTLDNIANLNEARVRYLIDRWAGTRLGRQELEGILLDEVEGALWTRDLIERQKVSYHNPPYWGTSVVGLDPSDGLTTSDEQGLAVVRRSPEGGQLYVTESEGYRVTPWEFVLIAFETARRNKATIVVEKTHGGVALLNLMEQAAKHLGYSVPYEAVDATKETGDHYTRAEPVAALYEQGKVWHLGDHAELEDQMCSWTGKPDPDTGKKPPSPDRMDALVWACWRFLGYHLGPPRGRRGVREWADPDSPPPKARPGKGRVVGWK